MKKHLALLTLIVFASITLTSCKEETTEPSKEGKYLGSKIKMGNDSVQSFVELNAAGDPVVLGVLLSSKSMQGLPADPMGTKFRIDLPATAPVAPYSFIEVGWNPGGHPPPGVYDKPHFDFHFYMEPNTVIDAISVPPLKDVTPIGSEFLPFGYASDSSVVPKMGVHWVDVNSDEFTPKGFSQTFIWGTYKGKVNFLEPMITKAFLDTKPDTGIALKQPTGFQKSGYYPKYLDIHYNAATDFYEVELETLTKH